MERLLEYFDLVYLIVTVVVLILFSISIQLEFQKIMKIVNCIIHSNSIHYVLLIIAAGVVTFFSSKLGESIAAGDLEKLDQGGYLRNEQLGELGYVERVSQLGYGVLSLKEYYFIASSEGVDFFVKRTKLKSKIYLVRIERSSGNASIVLRDLSE